MPLCMQQNQSLLLGFCSFLFHFLPENNQVKICFKSSIRSTWQTIWSYQFNVNQKFKPSRGSENIYLNAGRYIVFLRQGLKTLGFSVLLCFVSFPKSILKQIRQTTHLTKHHGEMNIGIRNYSPSLYAWLTVWWQKSICLFKKSPLGIEECRAVMVYCLECLCLMTNRTGIDNRELYSWAKMMHVLWLFPSPGFAKLHLQSSASISFM